MVDTSEKGFLAERMLVTDGKHRSGLLERLPLIYELVPYDAETGSASSS